MVLGGTERKMPNNIARYLHVVQIQGGKAVVFPAKEVSSRSLGIQCQSLVRD